MIAGCWLLLIGTAGAQAPTEQSAEGTPAGHGRADTSDDAPDVLPTPAETQQAQELFRRGVTLSREERWGEAIGYFRRSAALVPRPSSTFNIALALLRLGQPNEAKATLTQYITQSEGITREADRRAQATELMDLAVSSVAVLTLEVSPPDAEVRVDGVLTEGTGSPRVLSLDPGVRAIRGTLDGFTAGALELSLLEGDHIAASLALTARTDPARIRVSASVAAATIHIDDLEVGRGSFTGELEPGDHRIEVRAEGYEPFRRDLEVAALEQVDVTASLSRIADEESMWESPWLWVAVGAVLVGAGVGVGVGVASSGTAPADGGTTGVVLQGLTGP